MRNVLFLYLRQGLVMAANLVAVKIVLDALGVESQGICAAVAGWVSVFAFFSGTLRAAFQRFLSSAIGRGGENGIRASFGASMGLACLGALSILLIGETVGLWGVFRMLSYPQERQSAVIVVYQLSLVGSALGFLILPYQALAVARERMRILAEGGVIEAMALLGTAALAHILPSGVRIVAVAFTGGLTAILLLGYYAFRLRRLPEIWTRPLFRTSDVRDILSYFGWSMLGSVAGTARYSGTELMVNRRFGVAYDSSWSVGFSVGSCLYALVSSVQQAIEPQLVKRREQSDARGFRALAMRAECVLFAIVFAVAFPAFVFAPQIVAWWLGPVQPPEAVAFVRVFLVHFLFDALSGPLHSAIMSSVKIGRFQAVSSCITASGFFLAAVALMLGLPAWGAVCGIVVANAAGWIYRIFYFCRLSPV